MSIAETLRKAAALIEPKGAWGQGAKFRDQRRMVLRYLNPSVTCFCAEGAIEAVSKEGYGAAHEAFENYLGKRIWPWNDAQNRTQAEVVQALRDCANKLDAAVPA